MGIINSISFIFEGHRNDLNSHRKPSHHTMGTLFDSVIIFYIILKRNVRYSIFQLTASAISAYLSLLADVN